jgi:hypothetical protein
MPEAQFWEEDFDLSLLTYPQFIAFFFDRPAIDDHMEHYKLIRAGVDSFVATKPEVVVGHLQTMCENFTAVTASFSEKQVDQGLWAVFGAGIACEQFLLDPTVDSSARIACIDSMYLPFRDVFSKYTGNPREPFFWMWWDMILHTLWVTADNYYPDGSEVPLQERIERTSTFVQRLKKGDYRVDHAVLTSDLKVIQEAILRTLIRILAIDHSGCQISALHGLGHLHHPRVQEIVQNFLAAHRAEFNDDDLAWIEDCAVGKIA